MTNDFDYFDLFSEQEKLAAYKILLELAFIGKKPDMSDFSEKSYACLEGYQRNFKLTMADIEKAGHLKVPDDIRLLRNSSSIIKGFLPMLMYHIVCADMSDVKKKLFESILSFIGNPGTFNDWHSAMSFK